MQKEFEFASCLEVLRKGKKNKITIVAVVEKLMLDVAPKKLVKKDLKQSFEKIIKENNMTQNIPEKYFYFDEDNNLYVQSNPSFQDRYGKGSIMRYVEKQPLENYDNALRLKRRNYTPVDSENIVDDINKINIKTVFYDEREEKLNRFKREIKNSFYFNDNFYVKAVVYKSKFNQIEISNCDLEYHFFITSMILQIIQPIIPCIEQNISEEIIYLNKFNFLNFFLEERKDRYFENEKVISEYYKIFEKKKNVGSYLDFKHDDFKNELREKIDNAYKFLITKKDFLNKMDYDNLFNNQTFYEFIEKNEHKNNCVFS